jgi:hypothetical protein
LPEPVWSPEEAFLVRNGKVIKAAALVTILMASLAAARAAEPGPQMPGNPPIHAGPNVGQAVAIADSGRVRLNFNADWRFMLGEPAGAADPAFDDSGWERVGLPHSFSMPYFQSPTFYAGPGWYRKVIELPALSVGRRLSLEFEGAFQKAEIFVNGVAVGSHQGGYTGFPVDITSAARPGRNVVAVRVDNRWDPELAPRAGEHVFSGGLYRDVWLVATDAVHVTWTGTRVTTPDLSAASGRVAVETEIRNDAPDPAVVTIRTRILDPAGRPVATLADQRVAIPAMETVTARQLSRPIRGPKLWSPRTPVLYRAETRLMLSGRTRDVFRTEFGFRWFSWTAKQGFFLNGRHLYFRGANVHQDQAGWGDAVTNGAIERDVRLMKEAGFDFIRGSHYPHDPHFAEATDHIGMLFLSEAPFWGTGGFPSDWGGSAYPTDPERRPAFDRSVKQQLAEMIRINRNHPSIIAWGMDNEVFFSAPETMPDVRRLLAEEVALAHALDPGRPAAVDGAQRGDIDHIGDIAGYNGDGAVLFPDPGLPNFVSEYGSTISDRPGDYGPGWGDIEHTPGADPKQPYGWRLPWRSGEAIWAGFDHGSIAGRRFGSMGLVDYARLPKRSWYWYRKAYLGIAPPAWPQPGTPSALRLDASSQVLTHADGTDDVQLIVTVLDAKRRPLSNSPPVRLAIEDGPGELPTGRVIDFTPGGDISIRDGRAAIAMRSWQSGVTRIRATSPGLRDAVLTLRTTDGPPFVPGVTPLVANRPYRPAGPVVEEHAEEVFGRDNPIAASSSADGHPSRLANDGDTRTAWLAATSDRTPCITIDPERIVQYRRISLVFPRAAAYGVKAETKGLDGGWRTLAEQPMGADTRQERDIATEQITGGPVRLTIAAPEGAPAGLAEIRLIGVLQDR